MIKHLSPISGIAAFGDRLIATAGYDNQVVLTDRVTRRPIARAHHDHLANHCAFSPDGTMLVTSSSDHTARLWSVPDLRLVAVLGEHEDDVEMAVFHPRQPLVATASRDHVVRVHDLRGSVVHRFVGHTADVISVEWVGADELLSAGDDGTVKRWALGRPDPVEDLHLGGAETDTVVVDAAGTVYAGNDDGQILVLRDGRVSTVDAHRAGIKRLVMESGRGLLASLSYDRTMRLWRVAAGGLAPAGETELPADVWARSAAFAGASTIVLGTFGSTYRTFDHVTGDWLDEEVPPTDGLNAACVQPLGGPGGGAVLTVGDAGVVRRRGGSGAEDVSRPGSLCNFLTVLTRGGTVVTGGQLGQVFDARTGAVVHRHRSPLNCGVAFEHRGAARVLLGAYTGEGVVLGREPDGRLRHITDVALHSGAVKGVAVSGDLLFSVCADGSAAWHDTTSMRLVRRDPAAHSKIANGCAALDGGRFVSVSRDRVLRIWGPDGSVERRPTPHTHSVKCVATADDRFVATGSYHGHIAIHDLHDASWGPVSRPTAAGISSIVYHPGRRSFLASSYDGELHAVPRP